eukprot:11986941-Alexandrium_andersonii.AAC.1
MDGIEEVGEGDEVVVVGQPDFAGARAASSRSFTERLRQTTVQAHRVKSTARKTSAPNSRKLGKTDLPTRARTATPARPTDPTAAAIPRPVPPTGRALVVLSLFDGIGVLWHSLRELLTRTCLWGRL